MICVNGVCRLDYDCSRFILLFAVEIGTYLRLTFLLAWSTDSLAGSGLLQRNPIVAL